MSKQILRHWQRVIIAVPALAVGAVLSVTVVMLAHAGVAPIYTSFISNQAVGGYDVTSYYNTQGEKPIKGLPKYQTEYKGAVWMFASQANKAAFEADPEKYAPQYGGYCAWAVTNNGTARGDPLVFTLSNNKLYLNYNRGVQARWGKDIPGNVRKGDENWPKLLE